MTAPTIDADTYGLLLLDLYEGRTAHEIMERSDGLIYVGDGRDYFDEPDAWPAAELQALNWARGRVLDLGCGAGRISLYLQERGCDVVAIDESAHCVEVSRRRGVAEARALRWQDLDASAGCFDTIVLARNNFGLLGGLATIPQTLRALSQLANCGAVLISDSVAPSRGGDVDDQYDYRVRHLDRATPWFKYLMFEPTALTELVSGSSWGVVEIVDTGDARWSFVLQLT